MHDKDYESWQRERDFIEEEIRRLLAGEVPGPGKDIRIQRSLFTALVERREVAARKLMEADRARYPQKWRRPATAVPIARDITSSVSQDAMRITTEDIRL